MPIASLTAYAMLCALNTIVPGPNMLLALRAHVVGARGAADAVIAGLCSAMLVWGLLAVAGVAAVLESMPTLFVAMKLLGAAYIYWLGVQLVLCGLGDTSGSLAVAGAPVRSDARFFGEGFVTSVLNPNIFLFYLAIFPQFLYEGESASAATWTALALVAIYVGINALWFTLLVRTLERIGARRTSERVSRWTARAVGLALMGFGLLFVTHL